MEKIKLVTLKYEYNLFLLTGGDYNSGATAYTA